MPPALSTHANLFWEAALQESNEKNDNARNALVALDNMGVVAIEGPDAATFLQGQLTTNTESQPDDSFILSGHCDHKGRLNANFLLCRAATTLFYLVLPSAHCESACLALKKYAVFSKVTLKEVSANCVVFSASEHTADMQFDGEDIKTFTNNVEGYMSDPLYIANIDDKSTAASELSQCRWIKANSWHKRRILEGVAFIAPHTQGLYIPQMLNMDLLSAIDWHKGCYTGQEIIARMHYRGNANRRCFVFESSNSIDLEPTFSSSAAEAATILNNEGNDIGSVVESMLVTSANGSKLIGLASLKLKSLSDVANIEMINASLLPEAMPTSDAISVNIKPPTYLLPLVKEL